MPIVKRMVIILVILFALPYVVEPPVARFMSVEPARLELEALDAQSDDLDWRVAAYFEDTVGKALEPAGFQRAVEFAIPTETPGIEAYGAIFRSEHRPELAVAIAYLVEDRTVLALRSLNFTTVLGDGRTVETDNDPRVSGDTGGVRAHFLPVRITDDLERMHHLHCAFVDASVEAERIRWIPVDGELAEIQRELDRYMEARLESDLWFEDSVGSEGEERKVLRPTWRGAFEQSWGQRWPIGTMRRSALIAEAEARIRELPEGEALAAACEPMVRPDAAAGDPPGAP